MALEMNLPGFIKTTKAKYTAEMTRLKNLFGSNDPENWKTLQDDARTAAYDYVNALYFCTDTKEIWNKEICFGKSEVKSDEIVFTSLSVSAGTYETVQVASDIVTITGTAASTIKGITTKNPNQKRVVFYNKSSQPCTFQQGVGASGTQLHFQFSGNYILGAGEIAEFVKDSSGIWQLNVSSYVFKNGKSIAVTVDGRNVTIAITTINASDVKFPDGTTLQGFIDQGGITGPQGARGSQGPQGPQGKMGQGITIKGSLTNVSQLPTTGTLGDAYLINGVLYAYVGTGGDTSGGKWQMCGNITGPQGPKGNTGPQGPGGPQGIKGAQGDRGPQGPTGPQGPKGAQGDRGPTGSLGPQGPLGPQGARGPQGYAGSSGAQGPQGGKGPTGDKGPDGPQGPRGAQGPTGSAGSPGATGGKGPTGNKGPDGDRGSTGPQGPQGPRGSQGPTGSPGGSGGSGPQGPQGPRGPQGPQGTKGNNGDPGSRGAQGPQGPTGMEGPSYFTASGSKLTTKYELWATGFYQDSLRKLKKDINLFDKSGLDIINRTEIVSFRYKADKQQALHIGIIADDAPEEMTGMNHDNMDTNSCLSIAMKAIQELSKELKETKAELEVLKKMI